MRNVEGKKKKELAADLGAWKHRRQFPKSNLVNHSLTVVGLAHKVVNLEVAVAADDQSIHTAGFDVQLQAL